MTIFVRLPVVSYPDRLPLGFAQTAGFSYPTAQAMMWLAQLSYERDETIDTILARWQLRLLAHLHSPTQGALSDTATQGFVCQADAATIIVFAGTDPGVVKTVLTDGETIPDAAGMHPGFVRALDAVWEQLRNVLPAGDRGRLFVAGHSLGAALAVLAAFRLHELAHIEADHVYTFGLPRVGGESFRDRYESVLGAQTFRLVNGDDPVPAVPPPLLKFRHVGRSLFCPHAGTFEPDARPAVSVDDEPTVAEVETKFAGHVLEGLLSGRWETPAQPGILGWLYDLLPGGLADHMPARYLRALHTPVRQP
jgi:pimeloyl-ACP methyl ester carboxylesterase